MSIEVLDSPEFAKFILRVSFGGLFFLHGVEKITGGTQVIQDSLIEFGLPAFLAYLVYISEVIAPIFIILGVYTRLFSFLGFFTALLALFQMTHSGMAERNILSLEPVLVYFFAFLTLMLLGSGRFAVKPD